MNQTKRNAPATSANVTSAEPKVQYEDTTAEHGKQGENALINRVAQLDYICQGALLAAAEALLNGASAEAACQAGNAILIAHGRTPIDPDSIQGGGKEAAQ